jgi:hypothetical protein
VTNNIDAVRPVAVEIGLFGHPPLLCATPARSATAAKTICRHKVNRSDRITEFKFILSHEYLFISTE